MPSTLANDGTGLSETEFITGDLKEYQVSSRPVRWFARTEWWVGERAHRGIGSGVLEVEMWRFLATGDGTKTSFELLHNTAGNSWKLLRRFE